MSKSLAFLLVSCAALLNADTILVDIAPTITGPNVGLFNYSYQITNDISSSENMFSFALADAGAITSIVSPSGWTADTVSTPGFIIWTSGDQTTDLTPGITELFGFSDPLAPGQVSFLAFGSDPTFGFPTGDFYQGPTVGPTSVVSTPEPSSTALAGLVLIFILVRWRRLNRSQG